MNNGQQEKSVKNNLNLEKGLNHNQLDIYQQLHNTIFYLNMNLKKEIGKFRSQILIGEYESAISLSKGIMAQLQVLMELKIIKDDRLYNYIQEEYEKCLAIKNFIHNKIRVTDQLGIKKWGNKQQVNKWKKRQDLPKEQAHQQKIVFKQNLAEKALKQNEKLLTSPIKRINNQKYEQILQKIERQIMMPIKMPSFFKNPTTNFKLITVSQQNYANILTYFIENDFMSIEYDSFQYQFNKSPQLNYFYENQVSEILIDCKCMHKQQIQLSEEKLNINKNIKIHCIFITISQNDQYLIL